eukprot:CAMPEP_0170331082 /NCGR_PEP_ID=MMETSP0116_2-20130129/66506_1 /TAXON_ID=400756 /ORGANISM="Durinskia baltica, Strain CSIRO CS-38" /LENGTH=66 /DNA_ID=CAMNT_0010584315 /DNA_START=1 /DNA_END=197 /DNA_ORIENTATION=+
MERAGFATQAGEERHAGGGGGGELTVAADAAAVAQGSAGGADQLEALGGPAARVRRLCMDHFHRGG